MSETLSELSPEQIQAEVARLPIEQQALRHHLKARICTEACFGENVSSLEGIIMAGYCLDMCADSNTSFGQIVKDTIYLDKKIFRLMKATGKRENEAVEMLCEEISLDKEILKMIGNIKINPAEILITDYSSDYLKGLIKQILKRNEYFSMA